MSKYSCFCGRTFKKQKDGDEHVKIYAYLETLKGYPEHKIFKKRLSARICEFFIDFPFLSIFKLIGAVIIFSIFLNYLKVNLSILENIFLGVGLGMVFL